MITGKLILSDVCNKKLTWDEPLPPDVEKRWKDWTYMLKQSKNTAVPRSVETHDGNYTGFLILATWVYVQQYMS